MKNNEEDEEAVHQLRYCNFCKVGTAYCSLKTLFFTLGRKKSMKIEVIPNELGSD